MIPNKIKNHFNEEWLPVKTKAPTKGFDYFFSNYGRLKSVNKETEAERLLKGSIMKQGFLQLNLTLQDDIRQGFYVHKLVGEFFLKKPPEDKKFLIHIDGNKMNNYWKNLKWVDQRELTNIQIEQGVYKPENRKKSRLVKMTESKVRLLKKRLREGKTKRSILAKSFGITQTQLKRIENGENWGNVE